MPKKIQVLNNSVFGRLTVIQELPSVNKARVFKCICDCGSICVRTIKALLKNSISSCGCYQYEFNNSPRLSNRSENHDFLKTRLYSIWGGIKKRCNSKNCRAYKWYGAKGIKLCKDWENSFLKFREWALENGYEDHLTIERKDFTLGYAPNNCEWISWSDQNNNKSNSRFLVFQNNKITASQLARLAGKHYQTVIGRLNRGLTPEEAIL